jgi:2-phospho-L-lactate/phosphoenolpyruvate guanylyltransferase
VEWTVLVPVKELGWAKSRLRGALPGVPHPDLVLALVLDTLSAALACPAAAAVVVVTADETVAAAARGLGAKVLPDPPDGLNPALEHAAVAAGGGALAALAADLPALRGTDLAATLTAATGRGFVPDRGGTGTTLLAAPPGVPLQPRFGPGSARLHAASGAVVLPAAASLRHDVDTPGDLTAAALLGLGPRTARLTRMQGTVATFDESTGAGTVLLDDGTRVEFPAAAFAASGLRLLRLGQRVRLVRDADGDVTALALITMP